jgi:hypothetical protein
MEVRSMKQDLSRGFEYVHMGEYVGILKFSGGSFALMPMRAGGGRP